MFTTQRVLKKFIDDQVFLLSYDLAPTLPPLPYASCLSFSVFLCVVGRASWRGEGGAKSWESQVLY
jgi:hypothetical protein